MVLHQIFRSQGFIERAFYSCLLGFVVLSSTSFYVLYHHYSDIEMFLLRRRLSYMSDDEVKVLWKLNPGLVERAADLRRPFQDHDGDKSKRLMPVFQHPHPRVLSLQEPLPEQQPDIHDDAAMLNLVDPHANASDSLEDESTYMAPDSDIFTTSVVTQNDTWFNPDPNVIQILSWTPKYSFKKEWFMRRKMAFHSCEMPENRRCEYTADKDKYNSSDVVLFRLRLINSIKGLPAYRSPKQKWLVYESESPSYVWPYSKFPPLETTRLKKVFNISSTYSIDSNVPFRGVLRCWMRNTNYRTLRDVNLTSSKTKGVAWFVSNCKTPSHREDYVKELQKHIPVDIYGDCGPLKCGSQTLFKSNKNIDCYDTLLNNTYKFYLAFENSLCKNYVTEKLWNIFLRQVNIIPIVLGYEKYTDMIPKGTFLDVRDYASPAELAAHIQKLDQDDRLFNKYLRRKASLKCNAPKQRPFKCRLCEYLHKNRERQQVVEDIRRYWSEETKCQTPDNFYKKIANLNFTKEN